MQTHWKKRAGSTLAALAMLLSLALSLTATAAAEEGGQIPEGLVSTPQTEEQPTTVVAQEEPAFPDVQPEDWFYEPVSALKQAGVISGYTDGSYHPEYIATAGEALRLILSAAGYPDQEQTDPSHWAIGYLTLAESLGFVLPGEITDLNAGIDRLTIARLAAKALGLAPSEADSPFSDASDGYLTALYEVEILFGTVGSDGVRRYFPGNTILRSEIASVIYRIYCYRNALESLPLFGIDVSSHQEDIGWQAVADAGVEFAMIRLGYRGYTIGNIFTDRRFVRNIEGALAAGLKVGVYFFSQAVTVEEAQEEARYVLEKLQGYEIDLPVAFDWEQIGTASARTDEVDGETLTELAAAFCEVIEDSGYTPMVYFYPYLAKNYYRLEYLTQYDFWYASYTEQPQLDYAYQMWQYTSEGEVAGIEGEVDLNLCYKYYFS